MFAGALIAAARRTRAQTNTRAFTSSASSEGVLDRFWRWTSQERPTWKENKVEAAIVFGVFGVTGSTSVALVRPALGNLGLNGTMVDGPWSYRIGSVLLVSPMYACVLMGVGTIAGRHRYFASMSRRILGRFVPPALRTKLACPRPKTI